jgi:flavin reductase (DIM6/NTAB) family NADH-FMN oxidoreductase RutF
VNILGSHQEEVCRSFATKGADRFRGLAWRPGARSGSPILSDALAYLDCTIENEYDTGDHVIVVGRVHEMGIVEEHSPLLFFRGGYGRFDV